MHNLLSHVAKPEFLVSIAWFVLYCCTIYL